MITAASLMQSDPQSVDPSMPITKLERLFLSSGFGGFPVVEEGRLVGVVSRSDVVRSIQAEQSRAEQISDYYLSNLTDAPQPEAASFEATAAQVGVRLAGLKVDDVMSHRVVSVAAKDPIRDVASFMVEGQIHRVPVVEGDRLVGLLTSTDLVRAIAEGKLIESSEASTAQPLLGD